VMQWKVIDPAAAPLFCEGRLIEPLRAIEPQQFQLLDVFHPVVPFDVVEDVFYLMQRARRHEFFIPTAYSDRLRAFALYTPEMAGLIERCRHIHYVALAETTDAKIDAITRSTVPNREIQVAGGAELLRWISHDFSFNPKKPGACELCEGSFYDERHDTDVLVDRVGLVRCAEPTDWLVAQCQRGGVPLTREVVCG
jgi:hypothetical protein